MLHGVRESDSDDINERKQLDEKFFQAVQVVVTQICNVIKYGLSK